MPVFTCDTSRAGRPLVHHWEHSVGSGHAALGLRADWQAQLRRARRELGFRHVRFHGVLGPDMGVATRLGDDLVLRFQHVDALYDALLDAEVRPLVELTFVPRALASGDETVFDYRGPVTPPARWDEWERLVTGLFRHWVDRYGRDEVRSWPVEVWNEPNLPSFWPLGDRAMDAYFELYRRTVHAVREVDRDIRIGGPVSSKTQWIEPFVAFCEREGLPADFVSTHFYTTDVSEEGTTRDRLVAAPRDYLADCARRAVDQARGRPVYYTEWNSSSDDRDPLHDSTYAAAYVARSAMQIADLVTGSSFWTFSDVFVEHGMPAEPYHGGFGLLNRLGVPKPTYRAFQLLRDLGDERLEAEGEHETVDAWFTRRGGEITVLLTNHALPDHPIRSERVELRLTGASVRGALVRRIDADHANPKAVWQQIGAPTYPTADQVALLEAASVPGTRAQPWTHAGGAVEIALDLPPHAVAAVTLVLEGPS
jgi:xylan 1,4-beta-xylosidase